MASTGGSQRENVVVGLMRRLPSRREAVVRKLRFTGFGLATPDAELRARVAAAERLADAAAAKETTIDRKVDAFVRVMKAQGLTVKDLEVLRRRLQG